MGRNIRIKLTKLIEKLPEAAVRSLLEQAESYKATQAETGRPACPYCGNTLIIKNVYKCGKQDSIPYGSDGIRYYWDRHFRWLSHNVIDMLPALQAFRNNEVGLIELFLIKRGIPSRVFVKSVLYSS